MTYPFGSVTPGRSFSSGTYRYGFNKQEKDNEVSGSNNHYSAQYWEMDPRLGRRWNIDPVKKTHESPYVVLGNNPIWFVDPTGADTSFSNNTAREQFKETYNFINNAIAGYDKRIDRKLDKWKEKGYENERINKKFSKQIGRLNEARSELTQIKNSFDEVIKSDIMYFYNAKDNPNGQYVSGGGTSFNPSQNRVEIWFYSGLNNTIVHETRHGAGYSWNEWAWDEKTSSPTFYDYQDEVEAYRQESVYDRLINNGMGRTLFQIKEVIEQNYGKKDYIIKEYHQHCETISE